MFQAQFYFLLFILTVIIFFFASIILQLIGQKIFNKNKKLAFWKISFKSLISIIILFFLFIGFFILLNELDDLSTLSIIYIISSTILFTVITFITWILVQAFSFKKKELILSVKESSINLAILALLIVIICYNFLPNNILSLSEPINICERKALFCQKNKGNDVVNGIKDKQLVFQYFLNESGGSYISSIQIYQLSTDLNLPKSLPFSKETFPSYLLENKYSNYVFNTSAGFVVDDFVPKNKRTQKNHQMSVYKPVNNIIFNMNNGNYLYSKKSEDFIDNISAIIFDKSSRRLLVINYYEEIYD